MRQQCVLYLRAVKRVTCPAVAGRPCDMYRLVDGRAEEGWEMGLNWEKKLVVDYRTEYVGTFVELRRWNADWRRSSSRRWDDEPRLVTLSANGWYNGLVGDHCSVTCD